MTNNDQNIDKAKEWFLKAAREGSYEALYKLGQMLDPNEQSKSKCVKIAIDYYEIEKLVIPNSVTEIEFCAFDDCTSLQSIVIPNSVTEIGVNAFMGCRSLQSIVIPDSVTKIGVRAFRSCRSLQSIVIPNSVTKIEIGAVSSCDSLRKITTPNKLKNISIDHITKYYPNDKPYNGTVEYY